MVSVTNQLKLQAPDGKMRLTDVLDSDGVTLLAKSFPNIRASKFFDWFTYSESSIDGQSRKKVYTLFESGILDSMFKTALGLCGDWSMVNKNKYLEAMTVSFVNDNSLRELLKPTLTDKVNDREMFMKGIDYSYYYEEAELS